MRSNGLIRTTRARRFGLSAAALSLAACGPLVRAQDLDGENCATQAVGEAVPALERARRLTERFYEGELTAIWDSMAERLRATLGSLDALTTFRAEVLRELGFEVNVLDEQRSEQRGLTVYRRVAQFSNAGAEASITWAFDDRGQITGFRVEPTAQPAPSPNVDYVTPSRLELPFDGVWYVFWGGRTIEQNYHVRSSDQRFAYDFVVRNDGSSHRGSGERNEDYYCWGMAILAPAAAHVVAAVDRYPDQLPGGSDHEHPAGNHVVLDLGGGEYAVLAHLKAGSVAVAAGDSVAVGERLGACGNSGNTSEPHLHFHLQDGATIGAGNGLPALFRDYYADGDAVESGEPVRGQAVSNEAP